MDRTDPWFDPLYRKFAPKFVKSASLVLNNWAVAEEIVQDVFLIMLLYRKRLESYDHTGVWLYKTFRNRIGNELQRVGRSREVPLLPEYEGAIDDNLEFERLEDVLPAGLSLIDRQILIWYYEDDLSCKDIAKKLHRSTHACEAKLYRARNRCRELLKKEK